MRNIQLDDKMIKIMETKENDTSITQARHEIQRDFDCDKIIKSTNMIGIPCKYAK